MSKAFTALEMRHGIKVGPFEPPYNSFAEALERYRQQGMSPEQAADTFVFRTLHNSGE